jgi:SnoaL-like domain
MEADLTAQIKDLLDKQAIHEVLMRFARALNRLDPELVTSCVFPDAEVDMGFAVFVGLNYPDMIRAERQRPGGPVKFGRLQILGNELVELQGDSAHSETYVISYQHIQRDGKTFTCARAGRFIDRFERRDDVWKIAHRRLIDEWSRVDEVVETIDIENSNRSALAPDDYVYSSLSE